MLACSTTGDMVPLLLGWGKRHADANAIAQDLFQFMYIMQMQRIMKCWHKAGEQRVGTAFAQDALHRMLGSAPHAQSCTIEMHLLQSTLRQTGWKGNPKGSCPG